MTDAQIHAHYKATAHIEDVRFAIKYGIVNDMPEDLQKDWRVLLEAAELGVIKRAETHRRLWRLCDRWGRLQNERIAAPRAPIVICERAQWRLANAYPHGGEEFIAANDVLERAMLHLRAA